MHEVGAAGHDVHLTASSCSSRSNFQDISLTVSSEDRHSPTTDRKQQGSSC